MLGSWDAEVIGSTVAGESAVDRTLATSWDRQTTIKRSSVLQLKVDSAAI
jgi:hypothetical protein